MNPPQGRIQHILSTLSIYSISNMSFIIKLISFSKIECPCKVNTLGNV